MIFNCLYASLTGFNGAECWQEGGKQLNAHKQCDINQQTICSH